jgi:hypothetical protein
MHSLRFCTSSVTKLRKKSQFLFLFKCNHIHYVTQVTHLLFFDCKIGDFKIAGRVCLQKKVCLPSLLQGMF